MLDPELELFKTSIDLSCYAATEGYSVDRKESSQRSTVMRHANGDKIIVYRKPNGYYRFFSVRSDDDSGTIIDFIQKRKGLGWAAIREELRAWKRLPATALAVLPKLETATKNREVVR